MARAGKNHRGGRPPGKKTAAVIERDAAIKKFRERVAAQADRLFDFQFSLAKGAQYLFRIDKEFVKTGESKDGVVKKGYYRAKKPVIVENPEEMRQYLEDEIVNGDADDEFDEAASYYFLVARDPNNQAIDSMLDRTFGRSKSEMDVNLILPKPIYSGLSGGKPRELPPAQKPKKVKVRDVTVKKVA